MNSKRYYGELPEVVSLVSASCSEVMVYQYLPIKLIGRNEDMAWEKRLECFYTIFMAAVRHFNKTDNHRDYYIYLTAKHGYQPAGVSFNRYGYHTDGFGTEDVNYIWSNCSPTVFNKTSFNLTPDDQISMTEMEEQAKVENEVCYPDMTLLRLDQYNVHKVADSKVDQVRTFVKISFSKDKYDLLGNSHNYELDYNWDMRPRKPTRNTPQLLKM